MLPFSTPNMSLEDLITVKPVLKGHSKIDKTKVLKPCGSSMQVEIIGLENPFSVFLRVAA